jgi:hypothetical protein
MMGRDRKSRLTVDFLVDVLGFQGRDQLLEIVGCSSTVSGSNDMLRVHSEFVGLGRPRSLNSSDRVGKGTVLDISHRSDEKSRGTNDSPCQRGHHQR